MVGLPARGKSYITKKIARYLNWLQHDTRIFNVGERRRVVAGGPNHSSQPNNLRNGQSTDRLQRRSVTPSSPKGVLSEKDIKGSTAPAAKILVNGETPPKTPYDDLHAETLRASCSASSVNGDESQERTSSARVMEQSADFFDPENAKAAQIRELVALETLDEMLDYILDQGGSVGIFDATNSTLDRRKHVMERIRERAGPELGVLFLESLCVDKHVGVAYFQRESRHDNI